MYRLLIVDDEPLMRRGIKHLADLHSLGIETVFEAGNGLEALEVLNSEPIDILLLDINMPKMDGLTLAEKAKEIQQNIKICMITGYDDFDYAVKALRVGVDDYILKPVSKKDIEEVLKKMTKAIAHEAVEEEKEVLNQVVEQEQTFELKLASCLQDHVYESQFNLTFLADFLGFSKGYLSTVFKEIYGIPFQDYVIKKRIERGKLLLISTDMKNYEIAYEIGFEDVNYFATRFKKTVGMTPKQYKQKVMHND
jgi:two-component system response regulator YesN